MKWIIRCGLAAGTCILAPSAFAQPMCAQFEIIGNGASGEYNPYDSANTVDTFDIRITRNIDGVNAVRFLLLDNSRRQDGPGIGTAGPADYDIVWLDDPSKIVFSANNAILTPTNGATVALPGRQGRAVTRFRLRIPRGQPASAGRHIENLTIRYECLSGVASFTTTATEQIANVPIEVTVPSYVAAYIGSVGQTRGAIDFGPISTDSGPLSGSVAVTALSTVPYAVTFDSEREGRLRRRPNDSDGIAYDMSYAGNRVEDGERMICPATPAPIGQAEMFEVRLRRNSLRDLPAGDYSDTVTLTFAPRDGSGVSACRVVGR